MGGVPRHGIIPFAHGDQHHWQGAHSSHLWCAFLFSSDLRAAAGRGLPALPGKVRLVCEKWHQPVGPVPAVRSLCQAFLNPLGLSSNRRPNKTFPISATK